MAHRDGGCANLENHRPLGNESLQRKNQSASHDNNRDFLAVRQFLRTDASPDTLVSHTSAMAHTLARLVYRMLKFGHHYVDPGIDIWLSNIRQQQLRWTAKQAAALNMQLVPLPQFGG